MKNGEKRKNQEPTVTEFRHKAEMPLLILGYALTALVVIGCLIVIFTGGELKAWSSGILMALVAPVVAVFALRYLYFQKISNGVEMTKNQFPEMYNMYEELALKMGFSNEKDSKNPIPPLYLLNGNGVMNAFAAKCAIYDRYIVMHSDIVDVAYVHGNFDALKFVLAHELAHVKCHHIEFKRLLISPIMTLLFLGKSVTRAQEYTADRVACYYSLENAMGMLNFYAGKNLGKHVNIDEYFKNIEKHEKSLFLRAVNFMSDHAVGIRRMKALKKAQDTGNWDVHGEML